MRRSLPALSYHFGIKGADLDEMPYGEIDAYLDALDDLNREMRKEKEVTGWPNRSASKGCATCNGC